MKFKLVLYNDSNKKISESELETWYSDDGLKQSIDTDGVETLDYICEILSTSVEAEIKQAIKGLLYIT